MAKLSAGILLYRRHNGLLEVLLVHPGGPFWIHKDAGAWSLPKGEYGPGEEALTAALREFEEETGTRLPHANYIPLGEVTQKGGKAVTAWAVEGDLDPAAIRSNTFSMEWPPKSGKTQQFPEVDRAAWLDLPAAREKLIEGQRAFLDVLNASLAG
jgi:predicted NUDIX family NTP pyrophosphohydrolase